MIEQHLHLELEGLRRELRAAALSRPRLDRPDHRRRGRLRTLLRGLAYPPAHAAYDQANRVPNVTIRPARAADVGQLARLAEISERRLPAGLVLVAEVESKIIAAVPVEGGSLLSDLWQPTGDVVQLLELRSEQIRAAKGRPRAA